MKRVDVDDRVDTMGSVMTTHIWLDMDDWFLDVTSSLRWAVGRAVIE